jgi:DNA repair protein RadA/Sms
MKVKTVWYCNECGHKQTKWTGQCPTCREWNTLHEEVQTQSRFETKPQEGNNKPVRIKEVTFKETPRTATGIGEFDRLLGGGIVPGSLTLVGGDPGIGKSTLLLQLSHVVAKQQKTVLYISGEESVEQTSMRARRLGVDADHLLVLSETNFTVIKSYIEEIRPNLLIIDSIQILYKNEISSSPGSVSQVREITTELMHIAKGNSIATIIIGHVTKSGEIAGPRVLEHLVDTVFYFEGDKQQNLRMIRSIKNRFGATDEIAVFQMGSYGLIEVPNPSQIFLDERTKDLIGAVVVPTIEGTRPILIEAQALVTDTVFPTPSRRSTGMDPNRLALLLAVLEKKMRYQLFKCDVFVSIAGGLKITEPGIDLGILSSVASSLKNRKIDPHTLVVGEVGLGGEVRAVPRVESRIKEAIQMGFSRFILPKRNVKGIAQEFLDKITLVGVERVEEAIEKLLH